MSRAHTEADAPLILGRDLRITVEEPERYRVTGSNLATREGVIDAATLDLLSHFVRATSPSVVQARIADAIEGLEGERFAAVIEQMRELGWLTHPDVAPAGHEGFASAFAQHAMLADHVRVDAYRQALEANARGRTVLDLGAGTGLLAMLAAKAGAAHVYAVEASSMAHLARALVEANGLASRVTVVHGLSTEIELPARCDLLVHEILDTDPLAEDVLTYTADARARLLTDEALMLPERLVIRVAAIERAEAPAVGALRAEVDALGARLGLTLGPLADAIDEAASQRSQIIGARHADLRALSDDVPVWHLSLGVHDLAACPETTIDVPVREAGRVDGLVISFSAGFPGGATLGTGLHDPPTCWGWLRVDVPARDVVAGAALRVRLRAVATSSGVRIRAALA